MPIAWSWLLIDLQVPTVHYCILISSVSFAPFLEGGGYWRFPQDLSQWIADSQFISQQRNTLSAGLICHYQHTFVSGPSIQLAFLSFHGTGTLHDSMAMSCFTFLCCGANQFLCKGYLESVYSIAQNNSSRQTQKEGKSKQQTQGKNLNISLKESNWATNSKEMLKTTPKCGRQTNFDWMSVAMLILVIHIMQSPCPCLLVI